MTGAVVDLSEYNNKIVNMIKAGYDLKNKSDAINLIVESYGKEVLEPQIKPGYMNKLKRIQRQKGKVYKDVDEMFGEYE
ncbi:MAG: antitoxin [Candidatus Micrarchaeota archaeon]